MDTELIISQTTQALVLTLLLSLPPIIVATVVGVLVSLLQALTQVKDQTLGFAIKLIAVTVVLLFVGRTVGEELRLYAQNLFENFYVMIR